MPRGRKALPDAVKALRGNPGKRKLRLDTAAPMKGEAGDPALDQVAALPVPPPPRHLTKLAQEEWRRLAGELVAKGLLRSLDAAAFENRCELYALTVRCRRTIDNRGSTYKHGGVIRVRPEVKILADAVKQMRAYDGEFGLTPAARARVSHVTGDGAARQPSLPLNDPAAQTATTIDTLRDGTPPPASWTDDEFFRGPGTRAH